MRTLNVKAAVILLIVVIAVVGSTHLLHSYQVLRHSSTLYDMAVAAWKETPRRDVDAIQCMRSYLVLKPQDYKAVKELSGWLVETRRYSAAAMTLEELLRGLEKQDPPDMKMLKEVRRQLAFIWMDNLRNLPAAETYLKGLLQDYPLDHPEQLDAEGAELVWRLGDCQRKQGKEREAIACYKQALANDKNKCRVDIYYDLAMTMLFNERDAAAARRYMAEMIAVKQNAESPYARQVYAMWLEELGDSEAGMHQTDAAVKDYEEALHQAEAALTLKPDSPGALYVAAKCNLGLRHFPKAAEYCERGLKAVPQGAEMYILMADVYTREDRRDKAIELLKQGVQTLKSSAAKGQLLWHLANFELDGTGGQDNAAGVKQAQERIRQMGEYRFPSDQLDFLKARVLYASEDWESARKAFDAVRPKMTDFPPQMKMLYYWTGYCHLQQGDPDQADYAFHLALKYDPFFFKAHDGIAQIYISKGQLKDAVDEYRLAANANLADGEAWVAYLRAVLLMTLSGKEEDRNWALLFHELDRAKQLHPTNSQIDNLMLQAELAQGKFQDLEASLVHGGVPKNVSDYIAMADLNARHGKFNEARAALDEARAKFGDNCLLRLAAATLALRDPNTGSGAEIEKLAENLDHFSAEEKIQLLGGLFDDLLELRDFDRAKAVGRRFSELRPHDAMIRYRLLELDLATHNYREPGASLADIDRLLHEIEAAAGRGPIWNYAKAVRLWLENRDKPELLGTEAKDLPENPKTAMDYASWAQRRRKSWSRPDVLMGNIWRAQGDDDKALEHYLQASVNGERDPEFNRDLLQMLRQRQRYQDAEQVIRRLENNRVSVSQDARKSEAWIFALGGEFEKAVQSAEKGYDDRSDDYRDHLWHAQVLRILARRARLEGHADQLHKIVAGAEQSLRKAIEIAPAAADCRVELVLLLVDAERMRDARNAAAEAELMVSREVAPLALGYIYAALGEKEKAATSYEKVLASQPDNPSIVRTAAEFYFRSRDSRHAAPLIERLLSGQLAVSGDERASARRMKAAMLFEEGYPKLKEALALIEQNLVPPPGSAEDRRIKAYFLLSDPAAARTPETLALMEGLVKPGGASPEPRDRFELARLYLRRNQWALCREQMETLVNAARPETQYQEAYVKMLLDQNALHDAEFRLKNLEEKGKSGSTVALRAELMFRQGKWGAIATFLASYLNEAGATPEKRANRVLMVARLYEDFGQRLHQPTELAVARDFFELAGKLLQENAKTGPSGQMVLAAFCARRGRLDETLKILQQYSAKVRPGELAAASAAVIHAEKVSPQQLQQVETILTTAAAADKLPTPLLTVLGVLKITQGQPEKAEAYYRQVLTRDPNDFRAHNNLALLLALSDKKTDEALELINRAIELAGAQSGLLDSLAVVRIAREEPQLALEDLEIILTNPAEIGNPDYPVWLFHKARALLAAKNDVDARDVWHVATTQHGLTREQIDPPERAAFDKLENDLKEDRP
jgi:tetratricopeptide (TPR) repeat protein